MFDIGISELGVIAVVALIVIGPERLPRVARLIGTMLGRAQRYVNDVKAEVNREIELEELRKLQTQMQDAARGIQQSVTSAGAEMQSAVHDAERGLQSSVDEVRKDVSTASPSIVSDATVTPVPPAIAGPADIGSGPFEPSAAGPAGSVPAPLPADPAGSIPTAPPAAPEPPPFHYTELQEPPIEAAPAAAVPGSQTKSDAPAQSSLFP